MFHKPGEYTAILNSDSLNAVNYRIFVVHKGPTFYLVLFDSLLTYFLGQSKNLSDIVNSVLLCGKK